MVRRIRAALAGSVLACLFVVFAGVQPAHASSPMTVQITIPAGSLSTTISLPIKIFTGSVDWGDGGSADSYTNQTVVTHTYSSTGSFNISLLGSAAGYGSGTTQTGASFITAVSSWGDFATSSYFESLAGAFRGNTNLTSVPSTLPTYVFDLTAAFIGATSFNSANISSWNTSAVTRMGSLFNGASAFNQSLNGWDTSHVTTMAYMFYHAASYNGAIGSWNTSAVTNMSAMFDGATAFNQPIGSWDVSNVTNMGWMLSGASSFNQPVNSWNTGHVTTMRSLFMNASSFNQPVASWNTSQVTDMGGLFSNASSFNQPVNSWDTTHVTSMNRAFMFATAFNQSLDLWDTSNVTDFFAMFDSATSFNKPIGTWNTSAATTFESMFNNAASFNQNIGQWNISQVVSAIQFLTDSAVSQANYDALLQGWAAQTVLSGVTLDVPSTYSSVAAPSRASLVSRGWTINDLGLNSSAVTPTDSSAALAKTGVESSMIYCTASMGLALVLTGVLLLRRRYR